MDGGRVPRLAIKEGGPVPTKGIEGGPIPTHAIKEGGPMPTKAIFEGGPKPTGFIEGGPKPQPPSKVFEESGIKLPPREGAPPPEMHTMALIIDPKTGEQRSV